jgi:hypothetical protein
VDFNKALVSFATAKKFDKANEAEQAVQPERRFGRVQKSKSLGRRRVNLVVRSFPKDVFPFTVTAKSGAYSDEVITALRTMEAAGGGVDEITLSDEYLKAGGRITERRLVEAGYASSKKR